MSDDDMEDGVCLPCHPRAVSLLITPDCDCVHTWTALSGAQTGSRILRLHFFFFQAALHTSGSRESYGGSACTQLQSRMATKWLPRLCLWHGEGQDNSCEPPQTPADPRCSSLPHPPPLSSSSLPPQWNPKEAKLRSNYELLFTHAPRFNKDIRFTPMMLTSCTLGWFPQSPPTLCSLPDPWWRPPPWSLDSVLTLSTFSPTLQQLVWRFRTMSTHSLNTITAYYWTCYIQLQYWIKSKLKLM